MSKHEFNKQFQNIYPAELIMDANDILVGVVKLEVDISEIMPVYLPHPDIYSMWGDPELDWDDIEDDCRVARASGPPDYAATFYCSGVHTDIIEDPFDATLVWHGSKGQVPVKVTPDSMQVQYYMMHEYFTVLHLEPLHKYPWEPQQ